MNEVEVFSYRSQQVRTVERSGEVWFVAKDVCDILELTNSRMAIQDLDEDEKGVSNIYTPGGMQDMAVISEPGLYALVLKSRKPEAKEFSRWVRHDVLPSIRKHGAFLTPKVREEILTDPDFIIRLAQELKDERQQRKALEAQAEIDKPKVIFADSVCASKSSILVRELAKLLRQNGVNIGQNRLFDELRTRGFLMKCKPDYNMPTQKSMDMSLMEIVERTINRGDGEVIVRRTPKITGKGQVYFVNMFIANGQL